jgi:hypothetical protein
MYTESFRIHAYSIIPEIFTNILSGVTWYNDIITLIVEEFITFDAHDIFMIICDHESDIT